jgi:DNA-binding response OmpR family regulator
LGAAGDMRVLVVDDDPYLRIVVSLELPSIELLEASTMDEAYELARTGEPAAVLVDRRLADGDGIELVRRMRRNRALAQLPILVITAGHAEGDREEVLRAGADEYLPKPLEPADLMARLARLVELAPDERRPRRARLIAALQRGEVAGDPDPLPEPDEGAHRRPKRRGLGRFRRS